MPTSISVKVVLDYIFFYYITIETKRECLTWKCSCHIGERDILQTAKNCGWYRIKLVIYMQVRFTWQSYCFPACTYCKEKSPLNYILLGSVNRSSSSRVVSKLQFIKFFITFFIHYIITVTLFRFNVFVSPSFRNTRNLQCYLQIWSSLHSLNRATWYIYVRKTNKVHTFSH